MQVIVTFRHMEPARAVREYAERKVNRVKKLLRRPIEAHVVLETLKHRRVADVSVSADGFAVNAKEETDDLYSAIDLATDKIERQVKKRVTKRHSHKHSGPSKGEPIPYVERMARPTVAIEAVRVPLKPMTLHQAIRQLEALDDEVLVFEDVSRGGVAVLYRRKNGKYSLIEPEIG